MCARVYISRVRQPYPYACGARIICSSKPRRTTSKNTINIILHVGQMNSVTCRRVFFIRQQCFPARSPLTAYFQYFVNNASRKK